jgi:hypothetical protein
MSRSAICIWIHACVSFGGRSKIGFHQMFGNAAVPGESRFFRDICEENFISITKGENFGLWDLNFHFVSFRTKICVLQALVDFL